jgi:hypothetical protein
MVTVWIALQDTDLTNGGMMTILGSQKWGLIPDSDTFFNQDMEALKRKYEGSREWIEEPFIYLELIHFGQSTSMWIVLFCKIFLQDKASVICSEW